VLGRGTSALLLWVVALCVGCNRSLAAATATALLKVDGMVSPIAVICARISCRYIQTADGG
jgi:hypothetical protein